MKTLLAAFAALSLAPGTIQAADDPTKVETPSKTESTSPGEREGAATIVHRDDVLHDRGGNRHLWPLLNTPEARVNYFEVTSRSALHFHPDADHRLYVLEGNVLVTCGTKTTKCGPGDFIVIPRGVRHCYDVAPGEKALLLTFDAPPYNPKKTVNLEAKGPEK